MLSAAAGAVAIGVGALLLVGPTASAEVSQMGNLRVNFTAGLDPVSLPRTAPAPIAVSFGGHVTTTDGQSPPQLQRIELQINRDGILDRSGLPRCGLGQIQPATDAEALANCRGALVGEGRFAAKVLLPEQASFPSRGRVLAFNGMIGCTELQPDERSVGSRKASLQDRPSSSASLPYVTGRGWPSRSRTKEGQQGDLLRSLGIAESGRLWPSSSRTQGGREGERASNSGASTQVDASSRSLFLSADPRPTDRERRDAPCHPRPAILAHVYGTEPAPTSYTIPFLISQSPKGQFGSTLRAELPSVTSDSGYVTGLSIKLQRTFTYRGRPRSYLSASCPAPAGFPGAVFPLAKATFSFGDGRTLSSTLTRNCRVR
jgi:hypothetical protein